MSTSEKNTHGAPDADEEADTVSGGSPEDANTGGGNVDRDLLHSDPEENPSDE